jgi:DNA-binding MarR family transcriptional regulator
MSKENDRYQELFEEVRRLHNQLRWVGDALHEHAGVTTAMRSLLFSLNREGPSTVPGLARERLVSRQIIQTQINELLRQKLVEPRDNPQHRRSKLLALTAKGESLVKEMLEREEELLRKAGSPLSLTDVTSASDSLRRLREHLEKLD